MSPSLAELILPHVDRDDLAAEMAAFYAEIDRSIARHRPTCWNRGACCKFGRYGHRLFVTNLELAYFVRGERRDWRPATGEDACPYQVDGLCTAREHRPLGCRIYYCDPAAQGWQPEETEAALARLKELSVALGIEYRYVEWLSALRELDSEVVGGRQAQSGPPQAPKPADPEPRRAEQADFIDRRPLPVIQ